MLAVFSAIPYPAGRSPRMSSLLFVRERLDQASDLAAILDAACDAFESMLSVLRAHEDPGDPMFGAVMMAAASAADGRDAVLSAPSLPPHRLQAADAEERHDAVGAAADLLASLSDLLAGRLDDAASIAPDPGDQAACQAAAWWARDIHALLIGNAP
jgi:hypothetical protein